MHNTYIYVVIIHFCTKVNKIVQLKLYQSGKVKEVKISPKAFILKTFRLKTKSANYSVLYLITSFLLIMLFPYCMEHTYIPAGKLPVGTVILE